MARFLLLLLAAVLLLGSSCAARPAAPDKSDEQKGVESLVRKANEYKNTAPLIGILTQPCSDCPGR